MFCYFVVDPVLVIYVVDSYIMAGVLQNNGKKDARTGPRDRLQGNVCWLNRFQTETLSVPLVLGVLPCVQQRPGR